MNNKTISISFDVQQLYYLPQYLPVYHRLLKQNAGHATFVFYHGIHDAIIENIIQPSLHLLNYFVQPVPEFSAWFPEFVQSGQILHPFFPMLQQPSVPVPN